MYISIKTEQLVNFVLNDVNEEERKKIIEAINTDSEIKERYLYEKRKHDVERYLDHKMDLGERCELEELLKRNPRLYDYFELKKAVNQDAEEHEEQEEEQEEDQDVSISLNQNPITKDQLVNFVLNDLNEEEHKKISEAINTNSVTKERYLIEKRKNDVERYLDHKMDIGERCEIEELLKINSRLYEYFELKKDVDEEEQDQDVTINHKHIYITNEQLINFILNDVDEKERKKISEAINTNSITKERYLTEKRKYDVDRYLDDDMDLGERCEIEELLKMNSSLYEHFVLNKDVNKFLQKTLKEKLENIHTELYDTDYNNEAGRIDDGVSLKDIAPVIKLNHKVLRIGKWLAAASIVLMMGLGGANMYLNSQDSIENILYEKYYEPFRNNTNDFFNSTYLIEAKKKYNNKEYDIAWLLIDNLPNSMTLEVEKTFYAGLTLMELENYTEAINKFKILLANEDLIVINSINQWYMALCYLKIEKRADAIDILEKIVANKNYNHSEAKKILKKLT